MKEKALTRGGLGIDSVSMSQGVREAIVLCGNEPYSNITEVSQAKEGLNIKMFQIKHGSPERG
jgi:hypothetical protein